MAARDRKYPIASLQHGADPQLARILPWSLGCGQSMIRSGTRPEAAVGRVCQFCGLEFFLGSSNANGARGRRSDIASAPTRPRDRCAGQKIAI
ncbi:MAG TPA: hypothetical protein DDZ51_17815 [Planctomycetaceae bacterium]|nr:hypothetical protein [Planctomycetaceae bacterium]